MPNDEGHTLTWRDDLNTLARVAVDLSASARRTIMGKVQAQKESLGSELDHLGRAIRLTSQQLDQHVAAPYLDRVGSSLERAAQNVERVTAADLAQGIGEFARARPIVFSGGVLALGIGGGRLLKGVIEALHHIARQSESMANTQRQSEV